MTLSFLIIVIVVAIVILALMSLLAKPKKSGIDREFYEAKWKDIEAMFRQENTMPLAVIEADKLLDKALKDRGFRGETMAERMVAAKNELKKREQVWRAHKLRNRLVHETNTQLNKRLAIDTLLSYKKAMKDLGVL